jgi:AraC-like DNA-binding protein
VLRHFQVQPDLLNGLLTIAECQQLKTLQDNTCIYLFSAREMTGQNFLELTEQPETLATRCALLQLWANGIADLFGMPLEKLAGQKLEERFIRLVEQLPEAELLNVSSLNLAAQLDCSERHFRRLFRQKFGESFHEHQMELRLQRACNLLSQSAEKISDIAKAVGFSQDRLFSAAFKKRFTITPSQWRKQNFAVRNGHAKIVAAT